MTDGAIEATLEGPKVTLKIDTGTTTPIMFGKAAWKRIFGNRPLVPLFESVDLAGTVRQDFGVKDLPLKIGDTAMTAYAKRLDSTALTDDGYIGFPFFENAVTVFDFPKGEVMWFRQDKNRNAMHTSHEDL